LGGAIQLSFDLVQTADRTVIELFAFLNVPVTSL